MKWRFRYALSSLGMMILIVLPAYSPMLFSSFPVSSDDDQSDADLASVSMGEKRPFWNDAFQAFLDLDVGNRIAITHRITAESLADLGAPQLASRAPHVITILGPPA